MIKGGRGNDRKQCISCPSGVINQKSMYAKKRKKKRKVRILASCDKDAQLTFVIE